MTVTFETIKHNTDRFDNHFRLTIGEHVYDLVEGNDRISNFWLVNGNPEKNATLGYTMVKLIESHGLDANSSKYDHIWQQIDGIDEDLSDDD